MKKSAVYLISFFMVCLSVAQSIVWEKTFSEDYAIQDVIPGDSLKYVLLNNASGSLIIKCDSIFNVLQATEYPVVYESFVVLNNEIYCSFLSSNESGVHQLDVEGDVKDGKLVNSGSVASHPQLLEWNGKIALVDNFEYDLPSPYPRVSVFNVEVGLSLDSTFFMPRDDGFQQYGDAVIGVNDDLYISGLKQKFQQQVDFDQAFIRVDTLLDFESAAQLGDTNQNWVGVGQQSITSFPSGAITVGQTLINGDTLVDLSILDKDGKYYSSHLITGFSSMQISNEAVVYVAETQMVIVLLHNNQNSYLLMFDLNGILQKQFMVENELLTQVYLHHKKIYLAGHDILFAVTLNKDNSTCELNTTDVITVEEVSYKSKSYFVEYLGETPSSNNSITTSSETNVGLTTICPTVKLSGELEGCSHEEVKLRAVGEESFVWLTSSGDTISLSDSLSISVSEGTSYRVKGKYGSEVVFETLVSADPACDLIPKVYEYVSPNADGENDFFYIENLEYFMPVKVSIVNSQNQSIYKNADYDNSWSPVDVGDGVYYYSVQLGGQEYTGQLVIRK